MGGVKAGTAVHCSVNKFPAGTALLYKKKSKLPAAVFAFQIWLPNKLTTNIRYLRFEAAGKRMIYFYYFLLLCKKKTKIKIIYHVRRSHFSHSLYRNFWGKLTHTSRIVMRIFLTILFFLLTIFIFIFFLKITHNQIDFFLLNSAQLVKVLNFVYVSL